MLVSGRVRFLDFIHMILHDNFLEVGVDIRSSSPSGMMTSLLDPKIDLYL